LTDQLSEVPQHALGIGFQPREEAEGANRLENRHAPAVQGQAAKLTGRAQ
jgi:hypothetical protein